jgi:uncharacterized membrane protein
MANIILYTIGIIFWFTLAAVCVCNERVANRIGLKTFYGVFGLCAIGITPVINFLAALVVIILCAINSPTPTWMTLHGGTRKGLDD